MMNPQKLETQALAQLVERRKRGVSFAGLAWKYRIRWLILTALCVAGAWCFHQANSPIAVGLVAGLGVGVILGDMRHLRVANRLWPLHQKIIDWNRVEELIQTSSDENSIG